MKKLLSIVTANAILLPFIASPVFALGQENISPCDTTHNNAGPGDPADMQTKLCNLSHAGIGKIIANVIIAVLVISAVIALFFLILGGIRWILSGGDKAKVDAARSTIVAAIIGLIITFLAFFIINIVLGFFGLELTKLTLPQLGQ